MCDNELDFQTLARGPVTKYFSRELLEKHLAWYAHQEYQIYQFDAQPWYSLDNFYSDMHAGFQFPDYFGRNWAALNDCLSDITSETGKVLVVVINFDHWYQEDGECASLFLDQMADQTYQFLLTGQRWITLIQSNDPGLQTRNVGAHPVHWNSLEWMNQDRGL
ncbi:Barstar (barnase inhibitor) [Gimesia panareensis]|uniref:Barstar (Barnase inhibitor) n=1 Tax=Gimesia panareensis TaxID=2527978 RepID=A0A517QFY9_9PLAN|nr:barstar family protein [Gimesia panareensis]QDT30534.1 Barstar (barnase inhibitor) [Gimesia panareensis]